MVDHFILNKQIWNPNFSSHFLRQIWKRPSVLASSMQVLKAKKFAKALVLGANAWFHPKTPIIRKAEKYIDPSRLAIPRRPPPRRVPVKRQS